VQCPVSSGSIACRPLLLPMLHTSYSNTGGSTLQVHTAGSTLQVPHCRFPIVGSTLLHTTGPHCRFPIVGSTLLHTTGPHCRFPTALHYRSTLQVSHCRLHTAPHYRSTLQVPHCRLHTASHYRSTLQVPHCTLHTTVVTQRVSLMLSIQLPGSVTGPHLSSCSLRSAFRRVGTARHTCLAPAEAFGCSGRLLRELIIRVEIGTLCGHVLIVPQKAEPLNTPESAI